MVELLRGMEDGSVVNIYEEVVNRNDAPLKSLGSLGKVGYIYVVVFYCARVNLIVVKSSFCFVFHLED